MRYNWKLYTCCWVENFQCTQVFKDVSFFSYLCLVRWLSMVLPLSLDNRFSCSTWHNCSCPNRVAVLWLKSSFMSTSTVPILATLALFFFLLRCSICTLKLGNLWPLLLVPKSLLPVHQGHISKAINGVSYVEVKITFERFGLALADASSC